MCSEERPNNTLKKKPVRNFFLGKKETLAQSLADGAIKAVFSGIIVAIASLYIVGAVDESIDQSRELSKKRAALEEFQNTILTNTLSTTSASIRNLHCARDVYKLKSTDCDNGLDLLIGELQVQSDLLVALFPDGDFSSIDKLIETAREMKAVNDETKLGRNVSKLTEQFSEDFSKMIDKVAQHFK